MSQAGYRPGRDSRARVCNHATLPGQMHMTRLVHGPQLHMSNSASKQLTGHPKKTDNTLLKYGYFRGPQNFVSQATFGPHSPVVTGGFGGLIPPYKSPRPQIELKYETLYVSGILCQTWMSSPLHERKAPRTNVKPPYWRLSGNGSGPASDELHTRATFNPLSPASAIIMVRILNALKAITHQLL